MRLSVSNLYFSYPQTPVLKGINLCLKAGEIMCVVGPNGSGKSTLVKCIDALVKPCSGSILLDGTNLASLSRRDIAGRIGYVPQSGTHLFSTTVFDTVLMGRNPYYSWKSSEEDMDITADILTLMGLGNFALKAFNHLSGGQQQRVLIARALAQEPSLLLLDEPTSALDIAHQMEVMDVMSELAAARRIATLMVLHDLNLASRYADKILMLYRGEIFASGKPKNVLTVDNMARVYGVETIIRTTAGRLSVFPVKRVHGQRLCRNADEFILSQEAE